jgi:predicted nucleic acid-binding protein
VVIVDTSIWIDHLHAGDDQLAALLLGDGALIHPFVIGEIALGSLRDRPTVMKELASLDGAPVAEHDEVMRLIHRHSLGGSGIGYVDAHLLAATMLVPGAKLWTRDRRLGAVAARLLVNHAWTQ